MSDILQPVPATSVLPRARKPRFVEVRGEVLAELQASYRPGDRLPSEPDLASAYGVSRPTIRDVLRSLEGDGLVRRVHGVGTFVTQTRPAVSSRFDLDLGVTEAVAAANQRLGVQLLRAAREPAAGPIAERLELKRGAAVLWVERVIRVNDVAAAHAIDVIPASVIGSRMGAASSSSVARPTSPRSTRTGAWPACSTWSPVSRSSGSTRSSVRPPIGRSSTHRSTTFPPS